MTQGADERSGPPPPDPEQDARRDEVERLLRDVGAYQLEGYRTLTREDISIKEDTGHGRAVVTKYDVETEKRVFQFVEQLFPKDSFLGEENGNVRKDPGRYWILDPIDGTTNFTQGVPFWGPSLAFFDEEGAKEGWVFFPVLGQMFYARRGGGAFLDGVPIHSATVEEYSAFCSVGTVSTFHRKFHLRCPAKHRILGSIIANLCYVATGAFAATYFQGNLWDLAAGELIAREAGAVVDASPGLDTLDIASIDPKKTSSITVYAMANDKLPHFKNCVVPLGE